MKRALLGLFLATILASGCVSEQQVRQLREDLAATRAEVAAQPQTKETGRVIAVLDNAGNVVDLIPTIEDGASAGQAISATAPLAGPYAPWVTLLGGAITALTASGYFKRREDNAFDEGVERGTTGEVGPAK